MPAHHARPPPGRSDSDERLRLAVRASNVGFWDWDLSSNTVHYSSEWKRQIGCTDDEITHDFREWQDRVHPEDLPRVLAELRASLAHPSREYEAEFRFRHRDGSYRWILAQGAVLKNDQGKPVRFLGSHVDITRSRQIEAELRGSEELHRVTLSSISDTVVIADDDRRIHYVCPNVGNIFGWTPEEVKAMESVDRLFGPDLFCPEELAASGELRNLERAVATRSGEQRSLLVNVKRVSIQGGTVLYSCRDVSERRRVDDVFRSLAKGTAAGSEAFFSSLVRELATALNVRYAFVGELKPGSPDVVHTVAVWANGAPAPDFEYKLAGTPCEKVIGNSLFFYPEDVQRQFPQDELLSRMNASSYLGAPLFGSRDQPLGLAAVLHDQPMPDTEQARAVLTVFAARAGAELERLRTEQALRRSEALFRGIVEDQTEMIVRWKPDGTCTFANPSYCHAVGRTSDDIVGSRIFPAIHHETPERLHERVAAVTPAAPVATYIHEATSTTGKSLWEEWTDRGLFDAQRKLIELQSTGRDITERRRAEIRIRQLNRVYAVLSNINETIVREDDPSRIFHAACRIAVEKGGFLMAWVGTVDPSTGVPLPVAIAGASDETTEVLKSILTDPQRGCLFTLETLRTGAHVICNNIALDARAASWREAALARGYRAMASLPLDLGDGAAGTFNLYAAETGFFDEQEIRLLDELALDISFAVQVRQREDARRQAETARAESEERFRQLAETIQDVFWLSDAAMAEILYVSPAYATIWGRSCESLRADPRSWLEAVHPADRERLRQNVLRWPGEGAHEDEFRLVRGDGQERWIRQRVFPVHDAFGVTVRLVGVASDVTERRQLQEQVRQAQRMEAIGQLAGGVAHDFNNILTAIVMQADLGTLEPGVSEETRQSLQEIRRYSERAARLTRQLLLFSRRQVLQSRSLDLNQAVTALAQMLRRIIGENVRLELSLHPAPLVVHADPGMLDQVVMNLAINSRDAMPAGGRLLIKTAEREVDAEFAQLHLDASPGRYAWLSVSDTGTGIAPELLPRIFEPFFTTKEPGKGTGLGLATVYGIVKQHRGWIRAYSEPGRGATFQVFLPLHQAEAGEVAPAPPPQPRGGTETILVVEDEQPVRALIRTLLERFGYRVVEAGTGDAALEKWRQHRDDIALILTDLVMPGDLSGQQLARAAQAENPNLKFIFISGYSAELAGRELQLRPGENFLQKPFGPNQILDLVRQCLDR